MTVSKGAIAAMCCTMVFTIVLPIGLMLWLKKRGGKWKAFAVGAGIFFVFALVLEQVVHSIVLGGPLGQKLQGNIWLYAMYAGLMAGLFEEAGRLVAFRFLLRNQAQPVTALAYGAGHGGCEAVLITGVTMLNNLLLLRTPPDGLSPELAATVQGLAEIPASTFLWAGFERAVAIAAHIGFSVLVFAAVRSGKLRLFLTAVLLHAAVDVVAVVTVRMFSVTATELLTAAVTVVIVLIAARVYRKMQVPAEKA